MNLIDAVVTKVVGMKYDDYGSGKYRWWVYVEYEDIGGTGTTSIMCNSKDEAEKITIGYKFLH